LSEVYVSTDVEADGPIPGPHSMLSFASAAFLPDKTLVSTFSANLSPCLARKAIRKRWRNGAASPRLGPPVERTCAIRRT